MQPGTVDGPCGVGGSAQRMSPTRSTGSRARVGGAMPGYRRCWGGAADKVALRQPPLPLRSLGCDQPLPRSPWSSRAVARGTGALGAGRGGDSTTHSVPGSHLHLESTQTGWRAGRVAQAAATALPFPWETQNFNVSDVISAR